MRCLVAHVDVLEIEGRAVAQPAQVLVRAGPGQIVENRHVPVPRAEIAGRVAADEPGPARDQIFLERHRPAEQTRLRMLCRVCVLLGARSAAVQAGLRLAAHAARGTRNPLLCQPAQLIVRGRRIDKMSRTHERRRRSVGVAGWMREDGTRCDLQPNASHVRYARRQCLTLVRAGTMELAGSRVAGGGA